MEEKISNNKKTIIVTHTSTFHTDDCFAVATLLLFLNKTLDEVEVIRSYDKEHWTKGDFVVDVGGVYDENGNRFDHHQAGGAGARENGIPYAAFGLVWKKYGEKICGSFAVAKKVDQILVSPTDAHDNGVNIAQPILPEIHPYSLDQFVFMSNPTWKEDEGETDKNFLETVLFCKKILERTIVFLKDAEEARALVLQNYQESEDKRIVVLEKDYPWRDALRELPEPLYVVYPRSNSTYGVKAVSDSQFKNRKDFPLSWAGKRDEEMAKISGVGDAIFCHNGRFMAVAKSKEGAIMLAKRALE